MKKKQVIIIAAALAVVLLTGTAVYAVGNLGSGSNQANKPVEQLPLSTDAAKAEKAQAPLTAEQVDISAYSVPLGTKAEQILRDTLTKKQMTEQEMQYYNSMPDEIKMLTRAEAVERLEELNQWLEENEKEISEYTDEELEQRQSVSTEQLLCKLYIDCLATGSEHAIGRIDSTLVFYEIFSKEQDYFIANYPNEQGFKTKKAMLEFLIEVLYDLKTKAQNGDYDYNTVMRNVNYIENYFNFRNDVLYLESVSEELFDEYARRYDAGEELKSILGFG